MSPLWKFLMKKLSKWGLLGRQVVDSKVGYGSSTLTIWWKAKASELKESHGHCRTICLATTKIFELLEDLPVGKEDEVQLTDAHMQTQSNPTCWLFSVKVTAMINQNGLHALYGGVWQVTLKPLCGAEIYQNITQQHCAKIMGNMEGLKTWGRQPFTLYLAHKEV